MRKGMWKANMKKKLAKWFIAMAYKLDKFQLDKCTFTLEGPKIAIKVHVPEDSKWHNVSMNLSYWLYVGGDVEKKWEGKEVAYIDGVHLTDQETSHDYQTKVISDPIPDGPGMPLENQGFGPWEDTKSSHFDGKTQAAEEKVFNEMMPERLHIGKSPHDKETCDEDCPFCEEEAKDKSTKKPKETL